jgi:hypothetical protein
MLPKMWIKVLRHSPKAYEELLSQLDVGGEPDLSAMFSGFGVWFVSAFIAVVLESVAWGLAGNASPILAPILWFCSILPFFLAMLTYLAYFAILTGVAHVIARKLGGTGSYGQLVYSYAAIFSLVFIVHGILNIVTVIFSLPSFLVFSLALLYQIVPDTIAVLAVHRLGRGRATLCGLSALLADSLLLYVNIVSLGLAANQALPQ